ncbi:MAG: hypothetical protein AAF530_10250 [Pseudomonadota bacterium]
MASQVLPAERRAEFNLTSVSTLDSLLVVGLACAGLWTIIIATFGV